MVCITDTIIGYIKEAFSFAYVGLRNIKLTSQLHNLRTTTYFDNNEGIWYLSNQFYIVQCSIPALHCVDT